MNIFAIECLVMNTMNSKVCMKLNAEKIPDTETLSVSVEVTNTGSVAGKEVVQLYVSDRESDVFRPVRELKGFDKVELQPGETKTVTFTLDKRSFAYWNTQIHDWYVESGVFDIQIAKNAEEVLLSAPVTVEGTAELPMHFDENSIIMDIMRKPKAAAIVQQMASAVMGGLTGDAAQEQSEAAQEAVSDEMSQAMMAYMPLRSLISFSGGKVNHGMLADLLQKMND